MNKIHITFVVLAALMVSPAMAQTRSNVKNQNQIGRSGGQNHDLTKRALHRSIEEINKGVRALKQGLPIYHGLRVEAIQLGEMAKSEIRTGLLEQRLDSAAKAKQEADNESPKKYTDQQIRMSNEKLVIGGHHFENAVGILNRVNWDYEGHKTAAVKDLLKAIEDLKRALAPYGGPSNNMPKGGFKDSKPGGNKRGGTINP